MNNKLFPSLAFSVILHISALLILSFNSSKVEDQNKQEENKNTSTTQIDILEQKDEVIPSVPDIGIDQARSSEKAKDCEGQLYYGGIGVELNAQTLQVTALYEGYPASLYLELGDIVISTEDIRGTPGTILHITVLRNNQKQSFMIKREKICYTNRK